MGMRLGTIGQHWTADIRALAQLLHALRPEDSPGEDASRWQRFEAAVAAGSQLFHEPMLRSTAARCWLHACVGKLRRGSRATRARWLSNADALNRIQRFRAILSETLRRDAGAVHVDAEQAVSGFLAQAVDRLLADLAPQGLADTATTFEAERARTAQGVVTPQETRHIASGRMLLPHDFVSSDGSRVVRSLTTERQLAEHGKTLDICFGGSQRFNYLVLCRHGWRFVVGVFEAATGAPVSTADIVMRIVSDAGAGEPVLKQHTARENQEPSPPCRRAVAELLEHCRSPAVQRHLEQGRRILGRGGTKQMARFRKQADAQTQAAVRAALRTTLGSGVYDDLVAAAVCVRHQNASAH